MTLIIISPTDLVMRLLDPSFTCHVDSKINLNIRSNFVTTQIEFGYGSQKNSSLL